MIEIAVSGIGLATACDDSPDALWARLTRVGAPVTPYDGSPPVRDTRERLLARVIRAAVSEARLTAVARPFALVVVGQAPTLRLRDPPVDGARLTGRPPQLEADPPDTTVFLSHACASVAFALAYARTLLRAGAARTVMVVGARVHNDYDARSMQIVRALSTGPARPFHPARDGTCLGEGAGAVVLEPLSQARARGVQPQAVLSGVAVRVGGDSMAGVGADVADACIEGALRQAGGRRVDYVHAHAAGTRLGDEAELASLVRVGERHRWGQVPVSSHKGAVGHLLHASVLPGLALAASVLRHGVVPGTVGLDAPCVRGAIRIVRDPEPCADARAVLLNAFGFGGNHAALVLSRPR